MPFDRIGVGHRLGDLILWRQRRRTTLGLGTDNAVDFNPCVAGIPAILIRPESLELTQRRLPAMLPVAPKLHLAPPTELPDYAIYRANEPSRRDKCLPTALQYLL